MKVLDLQCARLHIFEGWFGSEAEFQSQLADGLLSCPLCGSTQVAKKLSAPRLNLSGATAPALPSRESPESAAVPAAHGGPSMVDTVHVPTDAGSAVPAVADSLAGSPALQTLLMRAVREIMRQTEDVGDQFAAQARGMHHGEREAKAIRGQATLDETRALLEEGIDVMPIPHLPGLKETLQ